jgi:simple sugar transport system substrate-binding protein
MTEAKTGDMRVLGHRRAFSRRAFLKAGGAGLASAALLGAAGCGQEESGQKGGGLVNRGDIRIEVVTHIPSADPFGAIVQTGTEQAQTDMGVEINYRAPETYDIPQIQKNFEAAIASQPNGISATIPDEDAIGPLVKEAVNDGIPVVIHNGGLDFWEKYGALNFVGQKEFEGGVEAGKRMAEEGVKNALCINHYQGQLQLDQRCAGFKKGLGGSAKEIAVEGENPTQVQNAVKTALRQNPDTDGMLSLGPTSALPLLKILNSINKGGSLKYATFDLAPEVLKAVRDGVLLFAIDQQPFLQGYLPITFLTTYAQYRVSPVTAVPTGPSFVTKDNAQQVIKLSAEGVR